METAEAAFEPIRQFRLPVIDFVGPIPLAALQNMFDGLYPAGLQWCGSSFLGQNWGAYRSMEGKSALSPYG